MSYSRVADHLEMVFDDFRNGVYEKAIAASVNSDSIVLDLGSGVGVLGLLALKHGARRVYMVDPSSVVRAAEKLAEDNGFAGTAAARSATAGARSSPTNASVRSRSRTS